MVRVMDRSDKLFLGAIALSVAAVIGITAYNFLLLRNYDFVTEAECNPETENCFYRDCSEEDACPPNGLEYYRVFTTSALDFRTCLTNSCLRKCTSGEIACEELVCDAEAGDTCSDPSSASGELSTDEALNDEGTSTETETGE